MKFTTTENKSYRGSLGYVPKAWITAEGTDHKSIILNYFNKYIRIYDFDNCGEEIHDFVFDDGTAYRLTYSWWRDWYSRDPDDDGCQDHHDYTIEPISVEEADVIDKTPGRDWL